MVGSPSRPCIQYRGKSELLKRIAARCKCPNSNDFSGQRRIPELSRWRAPQGRHNEPYPARHGKKKTSHLLHEVRLGNRSLQARTKFRSLMQSVLDNQRVRLFAATVAVSWLTVVFVEIVAYVLDDLGLVIKVIPRAGQNKGSWPADCLQELKVHEKKRDARSFFPTYYGGFFLCPR